MSSGKPAPRQGTPRARQGHPREAPPAFAAQNGSAQQPQYSLDQFITEAERKPWVMAVPGGEPIVVHQPDERVMKAVVEAIRAENASDWDLLEAIAGDQAERLGPLILEAPEGTLAAILVSLQKHFGWGNSPASPGS